MEEIAIGPAALAMYAYGQEAIKASALSPEEVHVVRLAVSRFSNCPYCVAAQATEALGAGVSAQDVEALQAGSVPVDEDLAVVADAARRVAAQRGHLAQVDVAEYAEDGLGSAKLQDIVAVVSLKTITNYVDHVRHSETDCTRG
jgi:AhpD family alkylhydroperoxidase